MNCPKCEGSTQVIDRRGVRRRRECKVCAHRFTTEEVLLGTPPRGPKPKKSRVYVPKVKREVKKRKPAEKPEPALEVASTPVEVKKPSRWAVEDLREARRLRELEEDWP
jgi:hypothetical protein